MLVAESAERQQQLIELNAVHTALLAEVTPRLEAYDREANRIDMVAKEFFARVIQHETDHLRGLVYLDRMKDLSTLTHLAEWNKYWMGLEEQDD